MNCSAHVILTSFPCCATACLSVSVNLPSAKVACLVCAPGGVRGKGGRHILPPRGHARNAYRNLCLPLGYSCCCCCCCFSLRSFAVWGYVSTHTHTQHFCIPVGVYRRLRANDGEFKLLAMNWRGIRSQAALVVHFVEDLYREGFGLMKCAIDRLK